VHTGSLWEVWRQSSSPDGSIVCRPVNDTPETDDLDTRRAPTGGDPQDNAMLRRLGGASEKSAENTASSPTSPTTV
jgi:hypothetical protein